MSALLEESHIVPVPSGSGSSTVNGYAPPLINSFQRRRNIEGVPTELLIQTWDDRVLVIVTQVGKVGCIVQASLPPSIPLSPPLSAQPSASTNGHSPTSTLSTLPPPPPGILLTPLLGSPPDETLYSLYASQISTIVWWTMQSSNIPRRPVVVGLALRRFAPARDVGDGAGAPEGAGPPGEGRETFAGVMELVAEWEG